MGFYIIIILRARYLAMNKFKLFFISQLTNEFALLPRSQNRLKYNYHKLEFWNNNGFQGHQINCAICLTKCVFEPHYVIHWHFNKCFTFSLSTKRTFMRYVQKIVSANFYYLCCARCVWHTMGSRSTLILPNTR